MMAWIQSWETVAASFGALTDWWLWASAAVFALVCAMGYSGARLWAWTGLTAICMWGFAAPPPWWLLWGLMAAIAHVGSLRRLLTTRPLMALLAKADILPSVSPTERTVLEAGTVWVESELFSGKPDLARLNAEPYPELSERERAFLDGPVETVCGMVSDWDCYHDGDLPPEVWDYLVKNRFFGLIIPEEYGGLGFSASANSAVVTKLASRSMALCITVMVPNSLGPAELLIHYGTEEKKRHYLPRLASAAEMPCFALTEAGAGSDAGGNTAEGFVFEGDDEELYLRLNWKKRYITLAPVATVLGLAFQLRDPDNLLGKGPKPGITCALIPTATPGVVIGDRHDPMGASFQNGPTEGCEVVMPIDCLIGGVEGAGQGWRMLTECLAAGRGISLPGLAAGTKLAARVASAHAAVRTQFGRSIGCFEGVEEPLARLAGFCYLIDAARRYTCGSLDGGAKPAVATAIVKYNCTELFRTAINDAMDILGGNAVMRGPRNQLAHAYNWAPILITAEGANILTRTLMVFGQGAIRCHPFAYAEIQALEAGDVRGFDRALLGHVGHVARNFFRTAGLSLSRGLIARSPVDGPCARYYRKLSWASAAFALLADLALVIEGGRLKQREKLSGRFADVLSWMYLGAAVLRRFDAEGRRPEDRPFMHWSMQFALVRLQAGFDGLLANLRVPLLTWLVRGPVAWWSRANRFGSAPRDELGGQLACAIQTPGPQRDALTDGIFVPVTADEGLARLERALVLGCEAQGAVNQIERAVRERRLSKDQIGRIAPRALELGIITNEQYQQVMKAEAARQDAIQVDSFTAEEYRRPSQPVGQDAAATALGDPVS